MLEIALNYWSILVSAVAQSLIGALWYSKILFGPAWLRWIGKTEADLKKGNPTKAMVLSFIGALVMAYVMALAIFAVGASSVAEALQVGSFVWLGFVATTEFNGVLFRHTPLPLFLINTGFNLATLLTMSVILTLWQ